MQRLGAYLFVLLLTLFPRAATGQIVNRLQVDDATFQRYAWGRMQQYNPANLALADSLYQAGEAADDYRYKCLGLALEFPVRFAQGEYGRMDAAVGEIRELLAPRRDARSFYYAVLHEYCQYLISEGRALDAMLEARAMERLASSEDSDLGRMYAHRVAGMIQSYRSNTALAIKNFSMAVEYCREARAEQELPNLYVILAEEYCKLRDLEHAEEYCALAEAYEGFYPTLRVKTQMVRAYLYLTRGDLANFWKTYEALVDAPLYRMQFEKDARLRLDVAYLETQGYFDEALAKADSLGTPRERYEKRQRVFANQGLYAPAYIELTRLSAEKDSIYLQVQNEDLAILDAEMHNAELREDAQRLMNHHQTIVLIGFVVMCALAFLAILFAQWRLRQNLDEMRLKNSQVLLERRAYISALDALEASLALKIKIMQRRIPNPPKL